MLFIENNNNLFEARHTYKHRGSTLLNMFQPWLVTKCETCKNQCEVIREGMLDNTEVLIQPPREAATAKTENSENCLRVFHCVLLGIICTIVYGNSLHGDFVHDDISAIVTNDDALGKTNIFQVFCNDFWGMNIQDRRSHKSYRPITILTFRYGNMNHF